MEMTPISTDVVVGVLWSSCFRALIFKSIVKVGGGDIAAEEEERETALGPTLTAAE